MGAARLRFHGTLQDFLPPTRREEPVTQGFHGNPAAKDVIEAAGVPHPEVARLRLDDRPARLADRLRDGARVEVFPYADGEAPAPEPLRFVLDVHLGRLAAYLRMLGFDSAWSNAAEDAALAACAARERRLLLTRDVGLLKRSEVEWGYWPRGSDPRAQLREVSRRFGLPARATPFTRCVACNGALEDVAKAEVLARLPPRVAAGQDVFRRCAACGRVFWKGTHHARMRALIGTL